MQFPALCLKFVEVRGLKMNFSLPVTNELFARTPFPTWGLLWFVCSDVSVCARKALEFNSGKCRNRKPGVRAPSEAPRSAFGVRPRMRRRDGVTGDPV